MIVSPPSLSTSSVEMKERDDNGRLKFVSLSQRLQSIDVDVVRRVRGQHANDDATRRRVVMAASYRMLWRNARIWRFGEFQRLLLPITWPLVQSYPELLHHQIQVTGMLLDAVTTASPSVLPSFLTLLSSLANDLRDDMEPYFHNFLKLL